MKIKLLLLMLLIMLSTAMNDIVLPLDEGSFFEFNEFDDQDTEFTASNRRRSESRNDFAARQEAESTVVFDRHGVLMRESEESSSFKDLKMITPEVAVVLADSVYLVKTLVDFTCPPVWGEGTQPHTSNFLCNVEYYVLDYRKTLLVVMVLTMFCHIFDAFVRNLFDDNTLHKSPSTIKYANSLKGLIDKDKNRWACWGDAVWYNPCTYPKIKPAYLKIQLQASMRLIGWRIIVLDLVYAGYASILSYYAGGYSYVYTIVTIPMIVQVVNEVFLESLNMFQCLKNLKCAPKAEKWLRKSLDLLKCCNWPISTFFRWTLGNPSTLLLYIIEAIFMYIPGMEGQAYILSANQDIRDQHHIDDNCFQCIRRCRWLKTVGHFIEDTYIAFVTINAWNAHYTNMTWFYWIILYIINVLYFGMKDKQREWYMRFANQFLYAAFLGYYSMKINELWKTFIAMSIPGQTNRSVVGTVWEWKNYGFYYYDTQNLYGSALKDETGENFFGSIFNSLGRPSNSVGWHIWNIGIVIFGVFSVMSMIFPDPDTPVARLLTCMKHRGLSFRVSFYVLSATLVALAYEIFLQYQTRAMGASGLHHDLHFLIFVTVFQITILVFQGLLRILDSEQWKINSDNFKAWWNKNKNHNPDGLQSPLVNQNEINDDLVNNNNN